MNNFFPPFICQEWPRKNFLYNINTISNSQVIRIQKNNNKGIISWCNTKFSELTSWDENCMADSVENLRNTSWEWKENEIQSNFPMKKIMISPSVNFAYFPQEDIFTVMLPSHRVLQKSQLTSKISSSILPSCFSIFPCKFAIRIWC